MCSHVPSQKAEFHVSSCLILWINQSSQYISSNSWASINLMYITCSLTSGFYKAEQMYHWKHCKISLGEHPSSLSMNAMIQQPFFKIEQRWCEPHYFFGLLSFWTLIVFTSIILHLCKSGFFAWCLLLVEALLCSFRGYQQTAPNSHHLYVAFEPALKNIWESFSEDNQLLKVQKVPANYLCTSPDGQVSYPIVW